MHQLNSIRQKTQLTSQNIEPSFGSPVLSQSQSFFASPDVLCAIDEIVNKCLGMKTSLNLVDDKASKEDDTGASKEDDGGASKEDDVGASKEDDTSKMLYQVLNDINQHNDYEEDAAINHPIVNNDSGDTSKKCGDGVGCSIDCGPVKVEIPYISSFMKTNKFQMKKLPKLRQEVIHYSLFHDLPSIDLREEIVKYGETHLVTKDEILTLLPDTLIDCGVVECSALLLNKVEYSSQKTPMRFFFGVEYTEKLEKEVGKIINGESEMKLFPFLQSSWECWLAYNDDFWSLLNVEMVFFPLLYEDHYSVLVVNFTTKTVQYLDNRIYDDLVVYRTFGTILCENFSSYLKEKKHHLAEELLTYEFEPIGFDWQ